MPPAAPVPNAAVKGAAHFRDSDEPVDGGAAGFEGDGTGLRAVMDFDFDGEWTASGGTNAEAALVARASGAIWKVCTLPSRRS